MREPMITTLTTFGASQYATGDGVIIAERLYVVTLIDGCTVRVRQATRIERIIYRVRGWWRSMHSRGYDLTTLRFSIRKLKAKVR